MTPLTRERRTAIVALLGLMLDELPEPKREEHSASGFVDKPRPRTCPDCLANGGPTPGCETCGGYMEVRPSRLNAIALTDALPDDGEARDPYKKKPGKDAPVVQYGAYNEHRDHQVALDSAIARAGAGLGRFGVDRPLNHDDDVKKTKPYVWERERKALYHRYDIRALLGALDELRIIDQGGYSLVCSVYVYGSAYEASVSIEAKIEKALFLLGELLPDPLRAPGFDHHPAIARQRRRFAA